jgi:hypothetical protein
MAGKFLPRRLNTAFSRLAFPESAKALFAMQQGNPAYVAFWDDFVGTRGGTWPASTPYAATVGVNTEVIGITQAVGGTMTVTTAAADGDTAGQGLGLNWDGDDGCYFLGRVKLSRITLGKLEFGLTDAVNDDGAVAVKATPTFTATDCALFVFDRTEDANLTFITAKAGVVGANADWAGTFAADTYVIVEIVVQGDVASGYVNGQLVGSGQVEGGSSLTPWAYAETLAGASATITATVDYWGITGLRS